ncbi:MAG: hypothetical protein AABW99_03270 [archaeon]
MVFGASEATELKRTSAEKVLLRNIHALESAFSHEKDREKKREFKAQLDELKSLLDRLSGESYTSLKLENAELKRQASQLRSVLAKEQRESGLNDAASMKLYELLFRKYAKLISENERKTVGEIKALVTRDDLNIQSLIQLFGPEDYVFENHYARAAEKAFNYVRDEIALVKADLGISFWLSPKEIISEKIGDDEDRAVLLCSLLYALGDEKAEVVIAEMESASSHAFAITEFFGKFLLLDPCPGCGFRDFLGEKKGVLEKYSCNGARIRRFLYRFNSANYEQFE